MGLNLLFILLVFLIFVTTTGNPETPPPPEVPSSCFLKVLLNSESTYVKLPKTQAHIAALEASATAEDMAPDSTTKVAKELRQLKIYEKLLLEVVDAKNRVADTKTAYLAAVDAQDTESKPSYVLHEEWENAKQMELNAKAEVRKHEMVLFKWYRRILSQPKSCVQAIPSFSKSIEWTLVPIGIVYLIHDIYNQAVNSYAGLKPSLAPTFVPPTPVNMSLHFKITEKTFMNFHPAIYAALAFSLVTMTFITVAAYFFINHSQSEEQSQKGRRQKDQQTSSSAGSSSAKSAKIKETLSLSGISSTKDSAKIKKISLTKKVQVPIKQ